jgi:pilus assembly protein Flp/PilA
MSETVQYVRILLAGRRRTSRGASAVEYGLLVALIGIGIIVAVTALGGSLSNVFTKTSNSISK